MKRKYITPMTRGTEVCALEHLLTSSNIPVGGDTDHFDTRKKDFGWSKDDDGGNGGESPAPWRD